MDIVLQQIVNAISLGGIYALLALGLAVVFSIVSLINFAHGELMTVAGYGMFFAAAVSLPFPVAVAIAVVFAAIAAVLTERFAFRPMRKADATGLLLTSSPSPPSCACSSRTASRPGQSPCRCLRALQA